MTRTLFLILAAAWMAPAQTFDVSGDKQWTDTGIDLKPGDVVKLSATGRLRFANAKEDNGPDGLKRGWLDMIRNVPVPDSGRGALVARVGDRDAARPFAVGAQREYRAPLGGRLFLGINMTASERAEGNFKVVVEKTAAPVVSNNAASLPTADIKPTAKLTQEQLNSIPRRVQGDDGTPGDRTNFIVIGSENKLKQSLERAGWVTVDRSNKDAALRGILTVLSKQAYVTLPMSQLNLFDRPQDYGYAQGDPLRVVAARHHFRIWKAPFQVGGETVWVGAGTHDIGFDRDQRNGKITHRIDSDTDKERDYIARSLAEGGFVIATEYMTAKDPIKEAKTAHGQSFYSDGRHVIVYLKPDAQDVSATFADLFCTVLHRKNPDGGDWGSCDQWIEKKGRTDVRLSAIPGEEKYRVVVVPGFFSSCFPEAPAFLEAVKPMKDQYGYQVDVFGVPNDPSEDNAVKIAEYLKAEAAKDKRKFILFGYSKGAPDIQVMLAKYPETRNLVAAFVSVAGASGGSWLAEAAPAVAEKYMNMYSISKSCQGDVAKGFRSLQRRERQAFLGAYPDPFVPTYSIPAIAPMDRMSKSVANTARVIMAYDKDQDGQLTRGDAIVPGSKILGAALSDHFALALPFEKAKGSPFAAMMDKNRYPRGALLEAMVRLVVADLEKPTQQ